MKFYRGFLCYFYIFFYFCTLKGDNCLIYFGGRKIETCYMKIVYVYPQFVHRTGTERVLIDKMNYLAEKEGYEIVMLTYEQGVHPMAYPLSPKVRHVDLNVLFYQCYAYYRLKRFWVWLRFDKLLQNRYDAFMSDFCPDIVITATYHAKLLRLITNCPVKYSRVLESHIDRRFILSNTPDNKKNFFRWLHMMYDMYVVKKRARLFDILIALNQEDAIDWSQFLKTTVIKNVVHLNPTGKYCTHENKNVIFVGRYMTQKGIPDLFNIWQIVFLKHPDWHLHLYGDGVLRDQFEREANRLQANIHIHQPDNQIFDRYLECSISVLTSIYEPFGLVMPEAMSCGLPVIAFDCPSGPADIITDGIDGFLIRFRNIEEFADRICQLIESKDLRMKMGKAAIESSRRFSANLIMPQWVNLFEELCIQNHNKL